MLGHHLVTAAGGGAHLRARVIHKNQTDRLNTVSGPPSGAPASARRITRWHGGEGHATAKKDADFWREGAGLVKQRAELERYRGPGTRSVPPLLACLLAACAAACCSACEGGKTKMQVLGTFHTEKRVQKTVDGQPVITWQPRSVSACKLRSCPLPACLLLSRPHARRPSGSVFCRSKRFFVCACRQRHGCSGRLHMLRFERTRQDSRHRNVLRHRASGGTGWRGHDWNRDGQGFLQKARCARACHHAA